MPAPWAAVAQCRIVGAIHGSETNNVINFGTNIVGWDNPNTAREQLIVLAQAVIACVRETLLPAVSSDWHLVRVEARGLHPTAIDPVIETGTVDDVGELGPSSVSFIASLVNVRTGQGGRRGRGRMFLPPAGEPQIAASNLDDATMLLLLAFLTCLAGKFIGPNPTTVWRLGILSRKELSVNNNNYDLAFKEALSLNPVARCAVLRSRKAGIGS
jgi:hypothetical protein